MCCSPYVVLMPLTQRGEFTESEYFKMTIRFVNVELQNLVVSHENYQLYYVCLSPL